jgi:hypothetical protein
LVNPEAVLSRSDLRELGYERRAIDAVFRGCPIIALPAYPRLLIRISDYLRFVEQHTYRGDPVRPCFNGRWTGPKRHAPDLSRAHGSTEARF